MQLEETENLKLRYVNRIQTNTTHINNIQYSDIDLSEKNLRNFKHLREKSKFKR